MPYAWRWSLHWLEVMTISLWMEVWLILISPTRTLCRVVWPFRHPDTTLLRGGPPFFLVFLMIFLVAFRSYGTMLSASVIGPARRNPLDPLHVIGRVTHLSLISTPCLQLWVILSVFFHLYCTLFFLLWSVWRSVCTMLDLIWPFHLFLTKRTSVRNALLCSSPASS